MHCRPGVRSRALGFLLALAVLAAAPRAEAHDARPLLLNLSEQSPLVYRARVRIPPSVPPGNRPTLAWPDDCEDVALERPGADAAGFVQLARCASPLDGRRIGIRYALFNPSLSTVARFVPLGDAPRTAVLAPDESAWIVPRAPSTLEVAADYLMLGVEHIWAGTDHLLFVVGLLLLARTGRRILLVVTGFTVAHSVTLSLSALGLLRLAVPPIEAAIALSIVFLAAELVRPDPRRLAVRYPLLVSSTFGLLHGLGFAAALGEIGLPPEERTTALLFFNVGVELGQLAFIAPFVIVALIWRARGVAARWPAAERVAGAVRTGLLPYAIGVLASFWFVERVTGF